MEEYNNTSANLTGMDAIRRRVELQEEFIRQAQEYLLEVDEQVDRNLGGNRIAQHMFATYLGAEDCSIFHITLSTQAVGYIVRGYAPGNHITMVCPTEADRQAAREFLARLHIVPAMGVSIVPVFTRQPHLHERVVHCNIAQAKKDLSQLTEDVVRLIWAALVDAWEWSWGNKLSDSIVID